MNNDAQMLSTGELCEALLLNSDFTTIIAQYELSIAYDVMSTQPHETKKREQLYATILGARGLLDYMQQSAATAAHIKAEKPPKPEGTTDYYVEPLYDDEGFLRVDEENDY